MAVDDVLEFENCKLCHVDEYDERQEHNVATYVVVGKKLVGWREDRDILHHGGMSDTMIQETRVVAASRHVSKERKLEEKDEYLARR